MALYSGFLVLVIFIFILGKSVVILGDEEEFDEDIATIDEIPKLHINETSDTSTKESKDVGSEPEVIETSILKKPPEPEQDHDVAKYVCSFAPQIYVEPGPYGGNPTMKFRLTTVCCPGTKKNEWGVCVPHCEGDCGEGVCEKPGKCSCRNRGLFCGYNKINRTCECPVCSTECPNAICIAKDKCHCNLGFRKRNDWTSRYTNSTEECIPYCFPFCSNNFFTTPENCVCDYRDDSSEEDSGSFEFKLGKRRRKSRKHLKSLFRKHGHPTYDTGYDTSFVAGTITGSNFVPSPRRNNYHGSVSHPGYYPTNNYGSSSSFSNSGYGNQNYGRGNINGYGYNPTGGHQGNIIHNSGFGAGSSSSNYGWQVPSSSGHGVGSSFGWPNYGSQVPGSSGLGAGSNSGNYGWQVPSSSGHGAGSSSGNYGWQVPGSNGHGSVSNGHAIGSNSQGSSGYGTGNSGSSSHTSGGSSHHGSTSWLHSIFRPGSSGSHFSSSSSSSTHHSSSSSSSSSSSRPSSSSSSSSSSGRGSGGRGGGRG